MNTTKTKINYTILGAALTGLSLLSFSTLSVGASETSTLEPVSENESVAFSDEDSFDEYDACLEDSGFYETEMENFDTTFVTISNVDGFLFAELEDGASLTIEMVDGELDISSENVKISSEDDFFTNEEAVWEELEDEFIEVLDACEVFLPELDEFNCIQPYAFTFDSNLDILEGEEFNEIWFDDELAICEDSLQPLTNEGVAEADGPEVYPTEPSAIHDHDFGCDDLSQRTADTEYLFEICGK